MSPLQVSLRVVFLSLLAPTWADASPGCSEPPSSATRQTVFVSDSHFGVGRIRDDGPWHPYEDSRWAEDFREFLTAIDQLGKGETDLVLNGDTFELWQSVKDDCRDGRDEDSGCTEDEAAKRLERVIIQHRIEMGLLGEFAGRAHNRIFIVPGNHDAALLFPKVAEKALKALSAPPGRACVPIEGYWLSRDGLVLSEHGHQVGHDVNSFKELWPKPFTNGTPAYLVRTWGERFVQSYYDQFELKYEAIDNMNDEGSGVWYGLVAEGKARSALAVAKFVKFMLLDESWAQFTSVLSDTRDPVWDIEGIKRQGDRFLVESIPHAEMRQAAERAFEHGELGVSLAQLSTEEIEEICNRRAALYTAQKESGSDPSVQMCARGHLGAIGERFLLSRDRVLGNYLQATAERLMAARRLTRGKAFQVFVYSHTHHAEGAFKPLGGPWQPIVVNTGAWQRLVDKDALERIKRQKGWNEGEALNGLKLENLPPCYSFVLVEPYKESPEPLLRVWARLRDGKWAIGTSCPMMPAL